MRFRRRIVRTFEFNRIFLFAAAICFAVAVCGILLSVTFGSEYFTVKPRETYFVTYAEATDDVSASEKAEECRKKGGAGYVFTDEETFYAVAAAYTKKSDAEKVAATLVGSKVKAVGINELRLLKSDSSKQLCEIFAFCAYTLTDELTACAEALDKRTLSTIAATEKCRLLKGDVERLVESIKDASADSCAAVKAFALGAIGELQKALTAESLVSSRLRYAVCAITVLAKDAAVAAHRG